MQKRNLRLMFTSNKWLTSIWAKEAKGKQVSKIVLMPSFWNQVVYILKVMGPLVKVLRLVDNERKLAMGCQTLRKPPRNRELPSVFIILCIHLYIDVYVQPV